MSRPSAARLFLPITTVDRLLEKSSSPIISPGLHPEAESLSDEKSLARLGGFQ